MAGDGEITETVRASPGSELPCVTVICSWESILGLARNVAGDGQDRNGK